MDAAAVGSSIVQNSASSKGAKTLADSFDTFLTLLTKQLEHQDPLDPVDSSEFTQQLVLFTQAEQSVATNKNLESLINLSLSTQAAGAVGYIGKTIQAEGSTSTLTGGRATWQYTLPRNATKVDVTITDANGKSVFNGTADGAAGTHNFAWDGRNTQGVPQPDGNYTIAISAKDSRGTAITASTSVTGRVSAVETVDNSIVLQVGGAKIPIDKVQSVRESAQPTNSSTQS